MITFKGLALVIGALVAAGGAVGNALWGPRAQARRRLREGSAKLADREVVTLTGTVREAGDLLEAPLSGRRCVLYQAIGHVKELQSGDRYAKSIGEIVEHEMVAFDLDIGDAVVRVEGNAAELELPPIPLMPRKLEREVGLFQRHGYQAALTRTSSCGEVVVVPGDRVAVQGMAIIELDPSSPDERGYRENAPRKIRLVAHEAHPLTIGRPPRR